MAKNKNGNDPGFLSKCSFCGGGLHQDNILALEESENKATFHITCSRCKTSSLVSVSGNQNGIIGVGMATDLDRSEVKSKFSKNAVSADEVIDVYQFVSREDIMRFLG